MNEFIQDYSGYFQTNEFIKVAPSWFQDYRNKFTEYRFIAFSKKSTSSIVDFSFRNTDILIFGREDSGLPSKIKDNCNSIISIPMPGGALDKNEDGVRSLNLSVACGIVIYKSIEQLKLY